MAGSPKRTTETRTAGAIQSKLALAKKMGAAGLLMVNDLEASADDDTPIDFSFTPVRGNETFMPCVLIRRALVEGMFPKGKNLADIEKAINKDLKPITFEVEGWKVKMASENVKNAV